MRPSRVLFRLSVLAGLLAAGCGSSRARPQPPPSHAAPADAAVAELDPGSVAPVFSTLPDAVRADIAAGIPREDPLAIGRARLGRDDLGWRYDDPADLRRRVRGYLESLYALEPIAFGPASREQPDAEVLLVRFWTVARGFDALARRLREDDARSSDPVLDPATLERLFDASDEEARAFAVKVLRHPAPEVPDLAKLARALGETGDLTHGRALWSLVIARAPAQLSADDWLAAASTDLSSADPVASEAALAHARKLLVDRPAAGGEAARVDARRSGAALKALERRQARVAALVAAVKGQGLDAELARADLLAETAQPKEAAAKIAALYAAHPEDPRVRYRAAQEILRTYHDGVPLPTVTARALALVRAPGLARADADLASLTIGLEGMAAAQLLESPTAAADPRAAMKLRIAGSVAELRQGADALAPFDPGRAAALAFVLDHIAGVFAANDPGAAIFDGAPQWVGEVERLIAKYPKTDDLFRIYYALAPLAGDAGLAMVAKDPPGDDGDLALQRARVASMQAADTLEPAWIALARRTADAVPPSAEADAEGQRSALRADAIAFDAGSDTAAWQKAAELYDVARPLVGAASRARIDNNAGFARARSGGDGARALFTSSAEVNGEKRWVPVLNGAFADVSAPAGRLAGVEALERSLAADQRPIPPLLHAWHAELAADPAVKREHARAFVAETTQPHARRRRDLGLELEGRFDLRLDVSSENPRYRLGVAFDAVVWLAPRPSLGTKELALLAKK